MSPAHGIQVTWEEAYYIKCTRIIFWQHWLGCKVHTLGSTSILGLLFFFLLNLPSLDLEVLTKVQNLVRLFRCSILVFSIKFRHVSLSHLILIKNDNFIYVLLINKIKCLNLTCCVVVLNFIFNEICRYAYFDFHVYYFKRKIFLTELLPITP